MKKLTYICVISFLLIGCTPKVTFFPDDLPIAIVGESYNTEIKIQGGGAGINAGVEVFPFNGLEAEIIHIPHPYNSIRIYGKPEKPINITLQIFGYTLGTSFSGKEFNKTYVIKVKEAD